MSVRLRPHHLLCLLTYVGRGYSPAFTANYTVIAGRIAQGEPVEIVEGPDDVCAPLLHQDEPHCLRESVIERDRQAARDVGRLLQSPLKAGTRLTLSTPALRQLRQSFAGQAIRAACGGCQWSALCDSVAADGYRGTLIPNSEGG